MNNDERDTFLFKYGTFIVYLVFFIGLFLNGNVAAQHFINARWLFGIWALFSILLLPKATLGLILLLGWKSLVFMNMSFVIYKVFPGTIQKYRSDSLVSGLGNPVLNGFIRQIFWLVISFVPIVVFLFQN